MRKRRNFRKRPKDTAQGLSVTVFNNNVEEALKRLKRKVKNSDIMQDLRKKEFFVKKSILKREKRNLAKLRNHYKTLKEKEQNNH
jgi:ribosomal protein S21